MKRTVIEFLIGLPIVIGVYALLDFLYCTLISHHPFVFDFKTCSIVVISWAAVEVLIYLIRRKKS